LYIYTKIIIVMKTEKIEFTKEEINKLNKAASREAAIFAGALSISTHRVHKNKKAYTRKDKFKKDFTE
jgi:hypothetical protein